MSDPKRATLITVGATKSAKNNVNKTVRLTINLDESNESKYPELNYKELVIAEERKKREKVENGKTSGLDPFSENNDDLERIARKFEQKYGGKSTYGRKGRPKHDDFADIGAGYDESDPFIDNTDGYDEMMPPECDTLYGGFYINCGSLEFKNVSNSQLAMSDGEAGGSRRNKRRISSSSSEKESSESSSESESQDEKDPKAIANGELDSHNTEHRQKKSKKSDKTKAKKIRRTDSSAATSGKQTSDDNAHGDAESADSRTSQSDSLTSKPAPSSENAITSDSSRDVEAKVEVKLPSQVEQVLELLEAFVSTTSNTTSKELIARSDEHIIRLSTTLTSNACSARVSRAAWTRAALVLKCSRAKLLHALRTRPDPATADQSSTSIAQSTVSTVTTTVSTTSTVMSPIPTTSMTTSLTTTALIPTTTSTSSTNNSKRKCEDDRDAFNPELLNPDERETIIVETLQRLSALIEERKPDMIANYNAECERVQQERKKMQQARAGAGAEGAPPVEKRLPKRRFPWCARSRALLCRLARLAASPDDAAALLHTRALPLFPPGFVRMPTLLRQADLSKEIKASDMKRQRLGSSSQPAANPPPMQFTEPIQFPSSLTVTTTTKQISDKTESINTEEKHKTSNSVFGSILNSFSINKDLIVEKPEKKDTDISKREEPYIPPNNIGSITITPVLPNLPKAEKKPTNNIQLSSEKPTGLIRVKSPAALNDMVKNDIVKKDKTKKPEKLKEKRVVSPLHIDTSSVPTKKDPSPKGKEEIPQKAIENMRVAENNIPRPALIPVHHSPTFAKPDKRPPEVKKKKDVLIVSDVDPLSDHQEPLSIDDSSSDVELVEDVITRTDKNEPKRDKNEHKHDKNEPKDKNVTVPCKDRVNVNVSDKKVNKFRKEKETAKSESEEPTSVEFDKVMRNLKEMEHSQEPPTKFNSNSYGGVHTNAKFDKSASQSSLRGSVFNSKDKLTDRTSLNNTDGCNDVADHESES